MNNTETKAAYKNLQITNIHEVIPISENYELAEICCAHENADGELLKLETFFLNKNNQIVAYFETKKPVFIKHLNNNCENLFALNYFIKKYREPYKLIRIEEDGTQTLLNEYENIEFEIEDNTFAVEKNNLWEFIDVEGN